MRVTILLGNNKKMTQGVRLDIIFLQALKMQLMIIGSCFSVNLVAKVKFDVF